MAKAFRARRLPVKIPRHKIGLEIGHSDNRSKPCILQRKALVLETIAKNSTFDVDICLGELPTLMYRQHSMAIDRTCTDRPLLASGLLEKA